MSFKVSVVMAAHNSEEYISDALDSIINQSMGFKRNIQIIIVNDASTDNTAKIAEYYQNKHPKNITLINLNENKGAAYSRNVGLKYVRGEYVNFLDSDDYITEYAFSKAYSFLKKHQNIDIASIPIYYFGSRRGEHILNFKYKKTQIISLEENPEFIQLSGASSFFKFETLKKYEFNENLKVSEDPLLINQILLENPYMGFVNDCGYFYRKHDTSKSLIGSSANHKSYYTSRVDEYFINLINISKEKCGEVPRFIQHVLMYDLQWIFHIHFVHNYLDNEEIKTLYKKLTNILSYIDRDIIMYQKEIPGILKAHIILLKLYGEEYLNNKFSIPKLPHEIVKKLELNTLFLDICQVQGDKLYMLGYITTFTLDPEIKVVINQDSEIEVNRLSFPQRENYSLNFNFGVNHHFEVYIPLDGTEKIEFSIKEYNLKLEYNRPSRLSKISGYMLSKNYLVINHDDYISIEKRTLMNNLKLELKTFKRILSSRSEGWRTGILLRALYFLSYPVFNHKRIWIFMDLPYLAEDNAYKLFSYVTSNPDSKIEKYFAVEKQDSDIHDVEILANKYRSSSKKSKIKSLLGWGQSGSQYDKIDEIGFVLPYKSIRHRLYALYAEAIVSSNPDNNIIYPFWGNFPYLSGLIKSKTVFLQHGVTKDDTSSWLNKYDKNIDLIVTTSEKERQSFIDSNYGYDENIVKVLGFPRFDTLKKLEDKKEVVVMPTWRRQYTNLKSTEFIKTDFYKVFNNLLNDEELLDFLQSEGYTLVFKPHPNLEKFMHLFNNHPKVDFSKRTYEDIFNHSSLLITDYSSVFFDFAYLKKPLIYYHYGHDYHFNVDTAYFKYEIMGFGPVARTYEELKNDIISSVLHGCEMEDEYKKRVDEFFKYHDSENSKRVYEAILNIDFDY